VQTGKSGADIGGNVSEPSEKKENLNDWGVEWINGLKICILETRSCFGFCWFSVSLLSFCFCLGI
jgi:hypothetical protein